MAIHRISFPRYEDISSEKRTLFHLLDCPSAIAVGDDLILITRQLVGAAKCATITKIDRVPLCPLSDDDMRQLHRTDRAEYLACWDALNPKAPAASNPLIYRIEFTYNADGLSTVSAEWCLAA